LKAEASNAGGELHAVQVDLSVESELEAAVAWVQTNLGGIDVLINNAGVFHTTSLAGGSYFFFLNSID
jgi:NAD(P)-dependent dehydrogenase (short-subunit alcohol dehydrogenase family)